MANMCVMTSVWFARVVSFEAKAFFVMCVFAAYEVNNFKNNERRKALYKAASIHTQDQGLRTKTLGPWPLMIEAND